MKIVFWVIAIIGVLIGALQFLSTLTATEISAPQQAAGAAMALCGVVIPYCLARAISDLVGKN